MSIYSSYSVLDVRNTGLNNEYMDVARIELVERDALADLIAAAPEALARAYGMSARLIDGSLLTINRKLDAIVFNRILALGVAQPARAKTVDEGLEAFRTAGVRNWTIHVPPGSEPLQSLLAARGLAPRPRVWAKFVYPSGPPPVFSTGLVIHEIGPADSLAFGAVVAEAFGLPPETALWIAALVGRPRWRSFAAFDGPTLVGGGAVFIDGRTSWVGLGGTKSAARGRGAQSALLAARIRAALDSGADLITTETGVPLQGETAPSYRNIQRVGFRLAYERSNFAPSLS